MTAQELIDELQKVKDKSKEVKFLDWGNSTQEVNDFCELEKYVLLT